MSRRDQDRTVEVIGQESPMAFSVFYSWQSDLPRKVTRDFIQEAAEAAIGRLGIGMSLEQSPRLDQGTDGVSGIPSIGDTILGKIDRCGMFIADVSLVGQTTREDKETKRMPNPNVLFELGYAFARIGSRRIILAMNTDTEYGDEKELPFDLRFRRFPFGFVIAKDRSDIDLQRDKLSANIEMALRSMLQEEHQVVTDILKKLDGSTRHFMQTNSKHEAFWETEIGKNQIPGQSDLSLRRLLELGILECVPFSNESGYAYQWTYIGVLCIKRLNFPEPPKADPIVGPIAPSVITHMPWYDELGKVAYDKSEGVPSSSGG